jgi:hypothetical protein
VDYKVGLKVVKGEKDQTLTMVYVWVVAWNPSDQHYRQATVKSVDEARS